VWNNETISSTGKNFADSRWHHAAHVFGGQVGGQRIYVDGEVNRPALVPFTAAMTVLQSIAVAGGLKDTARTSAIVVIRRRPEGTPTVFTVDLSRVLDGTDTGQDAALMPFDVVYVPKSAIANVNVWVDQYLRKNVPVSFDLSYQINNQP
jgi:protein involved in polysaccharide export with SLBB domain